jgi:MFS family permease
MLIIGTSLAIPASILAGAASDPAVLIAARIIGGLSAGLTYPTTLALITVLWSGPGRTKAIAMWSALGTGSAVLGPLISGALLEGFDWPSVFLVTIPLAAVALLLTVKFVPRGGAEATGPVDNLSGAISAVMIGALIVGLNLVVAPNRFALAVSLMIAALLLAVVFVRRQRRRANPLYDLTVAARPTFWVAALAGIIIFGSLMGVMFINQQYLQDVLGYSSLQAGSAMVPAVVVMVLVAPRSAKLIESWGSRATMLLGQSLVGLAFIGMLLLWKEGTSYWVVAIPLVLIGAGVGLAATPSSNSLTSSVPLQRVGMASGTADLQRDLGGALMTSVFGSLLTAGYAAAMTAAIGATGESQDITAQTQNQLVMSYAGAADVAQANPQYADQIEAAARTSFLQGDQYAYLAGVLAIVIGIGLVFFRYPHHAKELVLKAEYAATAPGE